ncbi:Inosine-uridine nucleoside N-ribohydrolase [Chthonomonas calidirosea]|uniref:nucleoside hydrolase n=1 Tax=Chthonomonas calidirosea TaxID=454171 RepID=UPI0006DD48A7|nr:nucleoside hydrolase [Chthonomonas calidirosea]CEK20027.1 Inosine-uridine nucleoside N-ribohydrolase [Chthonomonas calidirosea]
MEERVPLLLDTDIGSDIDDAVALAYLLCHPRCDLLGITTVTGEPDKRASLADAICRAAGRNDVPIHVGARLPFLGTQRQPEAPQAEALRRWPHRSFAQENTAVAFLQETIRKHPGEITLLTIGPLTNIGLLFALDPEVPAMLKQLVMMGGRFFPDAQGRIGSEWNIVCDAWSAARVFTSAVPQLRAIGLDVTLRCRMPAAECKERFQAIGGPLKPVADMADVWFRHADSITFHDPLAAAVVFEPTLCRFEPADYVKVKLSNDDSFGETSIKPSALDSPIQVAADVNPDAFFAHYFDVVGHHRHV